MPPPTVVAMRKNFIPFAALLLCSTASSAQSPELSWTPQQFDQLRTWLELARQEGLTLPREPDLSSASTSATATVLGLARAFLFGTASAQQRAAWNILGNDDAIDLPAQLAAALARNDLNNFFTSLRPRNPEYEVLRRAMLTETDADKRATLIRNLERWRWMPLDLGHRYLLVNAPGFEVSLLGNGRKLAHWRVIVGKPKTRQCFRRW